MKKLTVKHGRALVALTAVLSDDLLDQAYWLGPGQTHHREGPQERRLEAMRELIVERLATMTCATCEHYDTVRQGYKYGRCLQGFGVGILVGASSTPMLYTIEDFGCNRWTARPASPEPPDGAARNEEG